MVKMGFLLTVRVSYEIGFSAAAEGRFWVRKKGPTGTRIRKRVPRGSLLVLKKESQEGRF